MVPEPLLNTAEVAALLGVKPATVYSYVSRGLLASRRNADGKNSLFAKSDIDVFIAGRERPTTPGIETGITLIRNGQLYYRGHDAIRLAGSTSYETVATLLWTGEVSAAPEPEDDGRRPWERTAEPFPVHSEMRDLALDLTSRLPATARLTDRLRVIVAAVSAADPLRFDTTPAAVIATGRQLIATMVHGLAPTSGAAVTPASLTRALWHRLTGAEPSESGLRALNAALVLLADHDIAASTLAARIAASTRAHPYAVVSAGLAALDGPLHGAASGLAYDMVRAASAPSGPIAAVSDHLRHGGPVPGFGHPLHPAGDPRARALFGLIEDGPAKETALRLDETMRARSGTAANIDLALAAFTLHHRMPAEAGEVIFAVARTAGWLAHALEEYRDRPLRFRPTGKYAGHQPP